ncbi:NosD domain-containing protein, partial [Brevibacillus sp. SYSU BS000544]|uniref:NosD domain-containing protein n=1 Tax=Brevibacillus sp. SYSU BS000544 TaxID=3416443 RepID=UPI003CE4C6FE
SKSMNSREEYAAVKVNSSNNIIENIEISDSYHGMFLKNAHNNLIRNVKVKGEVGREGGLDIAHQGNGIQIVHSNENKVENCYVDGGRDGIYVFYSDKNELTGNHVQNTRYGVHYMYAHYNNFRNNHFTKNEGGAAIMIARGTKLEGNEFSFHNSSQAFGVLLQSAQDTEITDNKFYRNLRGIYIDDANNGFIKGNQLSNNQIGVEIWSSANKQIFTENQFFHNTVPVIRLGEGKSNQWSKDDKGNFWGSEFPLIDLDQNGIGDDPVKYSSSLYKLVSENELIYLFINSPALGVYEKMNELLQNQEVMFEDSYPLIRDNKGSFTGNSWIVLLLLLLLASSYYRWGRNKA